VGGTLAAVWAPLCYVSRTTVTATRFMGLLMLGSAVAAAGCAATPGPAATPLSAEYLVGQIALAASAGPAQLVATGAVADFGLEQGVRLVTVRIVDRLEVQVHVQSAVDIVFAEPPRLCLVGPDSAPDDAGLQDPCWGSPDISDLLVASMPTAADGRAMLPAAQPLDLTVALERGNLRCDYAPGRWTLDLSGRPLVNGEAPSQSVDAPQAGFVVSIPPDQGPLPYLKTDTTRYCGLASRVYLEQGEPPTISP
jgi:hypothetical protein